MRLLSGSAQHIGTRYSQQDFYGFAENTDPEFLAHGGFVAIVCDGMGGMEHGDSASKTAVEAFLAAYRRKTAEETIPEALERSVREANSAVLELARSLSAVEAMGTTLVAASLVEDGMYFVSVGDSGVFHLRNGEMQLLNRHHVYANLLEEAVNRGTLSREEADRHPERESLTSFIGAETLKEIDRNLEPWPVEDGDTILLASDGMFKTLSHDEVLSSLRGNPENWARTLVMRTLAKQRDFQDNVTVLSVTLESEERAAKRTAAEKAPTQPITPFADPVDAPPAGIAATAALEGPAAVPPASRMSFWPLTVALVLAAAAWGWWYASR